VKRFAADLHIHTALSPCAMDEMTPPAIVKAAVESGLDMIAICDHNSAGNVQAVQEAARKSPEPLVVLAGIEITTSEEAHVLGLFASAEAAMAVGEAVKATLPPVTEISKRFGDQFVMDAEGTTRDEEKTMLSTAASFSLEQAVGLIKSHDGLAIASHVDRPSHSVMSQLGLFPQNVNFDAIEISWVGIQLGRDMQFRGLGLPMVTSSDSHFLSEIGNGHISLMMKEASFDEFASALKAIEGRRCSVA